MNINSIIHIKKGEPGQQSTAERKKEMTVQRIFEETGLIDDNTMICIRKDFLHALARGNWYQDNILKYENREVKSFTWEDGNKLYIDLKEA